MALKESREKELINSFPVTVCRHCGSANVKRNGFDANGIQKYYCRDCHRNCTALTGTIFADHRIPVSEWLEYWRNLLQYVSIHASSWNAKTARSTGKFWFKKTSCLLADYQDPLFFQGVLYYDETAVSERNLDLARHPDGKKLRGNSRNQINVGTLTDGSNVMMVILGNGHPTQEAVYRAFKDHIQTGSTLITDEDRGHRKLVRKLKLTNIEYNSKEIKKLPDSENPLEPVNRIHDMYQKFLRAHSGFLREELSDYTNLFVFIYNPPVNKLEKMNILMNLAFQKSISLKYREYYSDK